MQIHMGVVICTRVREIRQFCLSMRGLNGSTLHTCSRNTTNSELVCRREVGGARRRTLHTCSRTEPSSPPEGPHFAHAFENGAKFAAGRAALPHVFENGAKFATRSAALCIRVRERDQVRHPEGRTLHTCSKTEPTSPPGGPHFAHVFEKGAKFAAGRQGAQGRTNELSGTKKNSNIFYDFEVF